uniref:C2H2-type domain-containing protein n=2 Tax=Pectinophora gossypiella TaxID=13191 RepID=A0A1E1WDW3_PECGO
MEESSEDQKIDCCLSCLCKNDENKLNSYSVQNEALKAIFQVEEVTLCYFCKRVAQQAELFIQNVQSNQVLLENFHVITDLTLQTIKSQIHPLLNLAQFSLDTIELGSNDETNTEETYSVVYNSKKETDLKIKLELKDESDLLREDLEGDFLDDNDFDTCIKEEDEYPLKLLKEELELEGVNIKCLRKTTKKGKVKRKGRVKKEIEGNNRVRDIKIETLFITRQQCMEERVKMATDKKYLNSVYKCEGCVKGFNFKAGYDKHMEKHKESNGDYECDLCHQRMASEDKLKSHKRYHSVRYKCVECGLTRVSRMTIKDHYTATHCHGYYQYNCTECSKVFKRQVSLRKHIAFVHTFKERVQCDYCNKTAKSKEGLKAHMLV